MRTWVSALLDFFRFVFLAYSTILAIRITCCACKRQASLLQKSETLHTRGWISSLSSFVVLYSHWELGIKHKSHMKTYMWGRIPWAWDKMQTIVHDWLRLSKFEHLWRCWSHSVSSVDWINLVWMEWILIHYFRYDVVSWLAVASHSPAQKRDQKRDQN